MHSIFFPIEKPFSEMTDGECSNGVSSVAASSSWRSDQSIVPPLFRRLVEDDPYLISYEGDFRYRYTEFKKSLESIEAGEGSILKFA